VTEVVVFAAPGRDAAHTQCFASIEASDIGKSYVVSLHPEGLSANEHWRATHLLAARAKSEFVLVLEDDVLVNRHILDNIDTWRWKHNRDFGAGWVYNPGGYSTNKDTWYRGAKPWAMTPGVLYRTDTLAKFVEVAWEKMNAPKSPLPWDCAIAFAAEGDGKRIRVHFPSLVEHLNDVPSKIGNSSKSSMRTSGGTFRPDWRRPIDDANGIVDRFGRRVDPNQR
jgi:hypothetical protein